MNRRGFLKGILAAGVAPAVVSSAALMPLWTPPRPVLTTADIKRAVEKMQSHDALFTGEIGQYETVVIIESKEIPHWIWLDNSTRWYFR